MFNGVVLPDGSRVKFSKQVSSKVRVDEITIRNHPAYNRRGAAKQLTATGFIPNGEYLGSYAGKIVFTGLADNSDEKNDSKEDEKSLETNKRSGYDPNDKGKEEYSGGSGSEMELENSNESDADEVVADNIDEEEDNNSNDGEWNPYQIAPSAELNYYVDGEDIGNEMRYINDAKGVGTKEPNVGFFISSRRTRGYYIAEIIAIKDIQPGEEILVSYGDGYWDSLNKWYKRKNVYACPDCDYRTDTKNKLTVHISREKAPVDKFECEYCEFTSRTKSELKAHSNAHTAEIIYKCDSCKFTTLCASSLTEHKIRHTNIRFKCFECGALKTKASSLALHIQVVHRKEKPFKCKECDYEASLKYRLDEHITAIHRKEKPLKCDKCDFRCAASASLNMHVKAVHRKERSHSCNQCTYRAVTKSAVDKHKESVHEQRRQHKCDKCSYESASRSNLNKHVQYMHTSNIELFNCDQCKYKATQKAHLKRHKAHVHEKKRPHECDECDYAAAEKWILKKHKKKIHEEDDNVDDE